MTLLYEYMGLKLPEKVYELLLLGTVADVVPLTGENRFWVRHGLSIVNQKESLPLKILKDNVQFKKSTLSSTDIGFFITPQINALGRLEDARRGVRFLIGSDQFNQARKDVEKKVYADVINSIDPERKGIGDQRIIIACSSEWPPGIIGLVASKIVGAYNRPTILLHITKEGLAKGSCRSTPDFSIFNALQANKDLLISFGGHAVAAGLALDQANLPILKERLEEYIRTAVPFVSDKPLLKLDAEICLSEVNKKLTSDMQYLEPFGNENTQPVFYLRNATLVDGPTVLKEVHIKCTVFSDGVLKPMIFFNRPDLYQSLLNKKDEPIDFAVCVVTNEWNGKVSVELQGLDVAL
jgi:single-stranded-DNA-specific exonuclease